MPSKKSYGVEWVIREILGVAGAFFFMAAVVAYMAMNDHVASAFATADMSKEAIKALADNIISWCIRGMLGTVGVCVILAVLFAKPEGK